MTTTDPTSDVTWTIVKRRAAKMQYCLLSPETLTPTEEVDPGRVSELQELILKTGVWTLPITAEKDARFVMDGHHRLVVARRLQLAMVPVVLLDYSTVRVESWRPGETITPAHIFAMARSGGRFPRKTTRHIFEQGLPACAVPLERLRRPAPAALPQAGTQGEWT
jgi:hypothetical protein